MFRATDRSSSGRTVHKTPNARGRVSERRGQLRLTREPFGMGPFHFIRGLGRQREHETNPRVIFRTTTKAPDVRSVRLLAPIYIHDISCDPRATSPSAREEGKEVYCWTYDSGIAQCRWEGC